MMNTSGCEDLIHVILNKQTYPSLCCSSVVLFTGEYFCPLGLFYDKYFDMTLEAEWRK